MIISHKHKFVFFAIPKTASQSIRQALRPVLGKYDWEQCSLLESKAFPIEEIAALKTGHIDYVQITRAIQFGMLNDYKKFCFFRDPLQRFLSFHFFYFREYKIEDISTREFMKRTYLDNPNFLTKNLLGKPQSDFISDEKGVLKADFVGRFEALETDFQYICEDLNLPSLKLDRVNKTQDKNENILDDELLDYLNHIYKKDFDIIQNFCSKDSLNCLD